MYSLFLYTIFASETKQMESSGYNEANDDSYDSYTSDDIGESDFDYDEQPITQMS